MRARRGAAASPGASRGMADGGGIGAGPLGQRQAWVFFSSKLLVTPHSESREAHGKPRTQFPTLSPRPSRTQWLTGGRHHPGNLAQGTNQGTSFSAATRAPGWRACLPGCSGCW